MLFYTWIWISFSRHKKSGHPQGFQCRIIGSRTCWDCIFDQTKVLECLKTSYLDSYLFNSLIFSIVLQIGFEIVTISLLFFSKIIRKDSIGVIPSFVGFIKHSLFSSWVINWINVFSTSQKVYLEWNLVSFLNCLSNLLKTTSAVIKFS